LTRCPNCLQEVPPTFNVCPRCGLEIASFEVKPKTKFIAKKQRKFEKLKTQKPKKLQPSKINYTL
jgi:predicted amidophosphoribosyltransferase